MIRPSAHMKATAKLRRHCIVQFTILANDCDEPRAMNIDGTWVMPWDRAEKILDLISPPKDAGAKELSKTGEGDSIVVMCPGVFEEEVTEESTAIAAEERKCLPSGREQT